MDEAECGASLHPLAAASAGRSGEAFNAGSSRYGPKMQLGHPAEGVRAVLTYKFFSSRHDCAGPFGQAQAVLAAQVLQAVQKFRPSHLPESTPQEATATRLDLGPGFLNDLNPAALFHQRRVEKTRFRAPNWSTITRSHDTRSSRFSIARAWPHARSLAPLRLLKDAYIPL